jgi:hypothetical protein
MSADTIGKVICQHTATCEHSSVCEDTKPHFPDEWGSSQSGGPFYCNKGGFRCKKVNRLVRCIAVPDKPLTAAERLKHIDSCPKSNYLPEYLEKILEESTGMFQILEDFKFCPWCGTKFK